MSESRPQPPGTLPRSTLTPAAPPRPPGHLPGAATSAAPPKIAPPPAAKTQELDLEPIGLVGSEADSAAPSKIKAFGSHTTAAKEKWTRQLDAPGTGACRVRTFHGRLSDEGMVFLDDKINEWLDQHPEVEVKFVTTTIGVFEGKIREQALIMNVWY